MSSKVRGVSSLQGIKNVDFRQAEVALGVSTRNPISLQVDRGQRPTSALRAPLAWLRLLVYVVGTHMEHQCPGPCS